MKHEIQPLEIKEFQGGQGLRNLGLVLGLLGLAGFGVGFVTDKQQAVFSYLTAFAYVNSIVVGALIFLMIGYLVRAKWLLGVRRVAEAVTVGQLALIPLFLPVVLGMTELYLWMRPEEAEGHLRHLLEHKSAYLSQSGFLVRAAVYFAIWCGFGWSLRRASLQKDKDASFVGGQYGTSALGVILTGTALTFASFDWMMSLLPQWFSAAYGIHHFAGGFGAFVALLIIIVSRLDKAGLMKGLINPDGSHYHAMGRLLLGFTIFWAYISYFQGFLIYIVNKPEETPFYLIRISEGWFSYSLFGVMIGHFVIPFFLLIWRKPKFNPNYLSKVAWWVLIFHFVDVYWQVMPNLDKSGVTPWKDLKGSFAPHWLDLACVLGIAGVVMAVSASWLRGKNMAPKNEPNLEIGRRYHSA